MEFIGKRKRKFGDRVDGHWVKDTPGMNVIMAGLYPNRTDCEVSARQELDVTELVKYIEKRNAKNPDHPIKFFHCFITCLARVLNERRKLNYFVRRCRIFERDEISISFVAKRQFSDAAHEVLVTYKARKDDTVNEVSKFILGEVKTIRNEDTKKVKNKANITESLDKFARIPRFILIPLIRFVRMLDYFGKVPKGIKKGDPAFSTVLVANLGSIKCPSVYHHLNNYGTNSIVMTIGTLKKKSILQEDGSVVTRDVVDITSTLDERIADGFYFIKSIMLLEKYFQHPEVLEKRLEEDFPLED